MRTFCKEPQVLLIPFFVGLGRPECELRRCVHSVDEVVEASVCRSNRHLEDVTNIRQAPPCKCPQANPDYVLRQDGTLGPAIVFDTLYDWREDVDQFAHGIRRHPHLGVESIFVDELFRVQSVGIHPWMHPSVPSTVKHSVLSGRRQISKRLEVLPV